MKTEKPVLPQGVYGITAAKFSHGRSNVDVVKEMLAGGISLIQYREKRPEKSFAEMYAECVSIRKLTKEAGVLFIVNDFPTLALLAEADGVHVGQADFPVPELRSVMGPDKIIGLSTHEAAHALKAVQLGADYIGVGPIFSTQTKDDVCAPVGLGYLDFVAKQGQLPFTAIGGIKEHNLAEVIAHGAKSACLVTEIVGADDIAGTVRRLQAFFK